jgi:hypothetical protein
MSINNNEMSAQTRRVAHTSLSPALYIMTVLGIQPAGYHVTMSRTTR